MYKRIANTGDRRLDWQDLGHGRAGATVWTGEHHSKGHVPIPDEANGSGLYGVYFSRPGHGPLAPRVNEVEIETSYNSDPA